MCCVLRLWSLLYIGSQAFIMRELPTNFKNFVGPHMLVVRKAPPVEKTQIKNFIISSWTVVYDSHFVHHNEHKVSCGISFSAAKIGDKTNRRLENQGLLQKCVNSWSLWNEPMRPPWSAAHRYITIALKLESVTCPNIYKLWILFT